MNASRRKRFWLPWVIALVLLPALGGCDSGETDDLWNALLAVGMEMTTHQQLAAERGDLNRARGLHMQTAELIDDLLQQYPDASTPLRDLAEAMSEGERRLGEGNLSDAEAEQLRQRHAEYWSHLRDRQLPAEFQ